MVPGKRESNGNSLATLAQYIGILIAMVVTPMLIVSSPASPYYGNGIGSMLKIYCIITIVASVTGWILLKEKPHTPVSDENIESISFFKGLKHISACVTCG